MRPKNAAACRGVYSSIISSLSLSAEGCRDVSSALCDLCLLPSAVVSTLSTFAAVVCVTSADQTAELTLLSASQYKDTLHQSSTVSSYPVEAALMTA